MSNLMSPSASPGVSAKKTVSAKSAGVRRVNNLPIYIGVGIMLTFLLIMMIVAMNRSEQQNAVSDEEVTEVGSTNLLAAMITGDFKDGIIEPETLPPDIHDAHNVPQEIIIARPDNLELPPMPPGGQTIQETNPDADHIRMMKMQLFEEAVKAGTSVAMVVPRSSDSSTSHVSSGGTSNRNEISAKLAAVRQQINAQANEDPTAAYHARLQQIRDSGAVVGAGGGGVGDGSAPQLLFEESNRPPDNFSGFDGEEGRWKLDSKPKAPATPYSLFPGFVIPAILISGINSDLPGQIMAQVSQDIYDSPVGKHRLIPQGARLVGSYSNDVAFGQRRVLVAWQRIIFPDGKSMDIGAMPGGDALGQSGFKDQVNNHYLRVFGSALLLSAVIAGPALSQRDSGGAFGRPNTSSVLSQSLGQQLGQATARLLNKNLNIAPTLQIRAGFRFNVIVTKDMVFTKPYQAFN